MSTHEELLTIVKKAGGNGHQFEWDPPAVLTSLRGRWTCAWCGDAVLMRHDQTCHGSAVGSNCVPKPEVSQVWESIESGMEGLQVALVEEHGAQFMSRVVKVPYELRGFYTEGQPLIVHRSRLRNPPAYKYGYKLIQDVSGRESSDGQAEEDR